MSELRTETTDDRRPDEWDDYEEMGPEDLEDTLDRLLDSAFNRESQANRDKINLYREEY